MSEPEPDIVLKQDSEPLSEQKRERRISNAVGKYGQRLLGFIRNRVPSNADAEDIAQEVWYQFSRVVDLDSIEQVSGWLFRVARNQVTDNYRRKKNTNYEDIDDLAQEIEGPFDEHLSDILQSEDEALKELFWKELFAALEELPEKQRQVFVWNELENETFQEIADRTGENIKTLISRKRYAVQFLRTRLEILYQEIINH